MNNGSESWTEERLALLHVAHAAKKQFGAAFLSEMNALDGPPMTRNAIIGKSQRLYGRRFEPKTQDQRAEIAIQRRDRENVARRVKYAEERIVVRKPAPVRASPRAAAPVIVHRAEDMKPRFIDLLDLEPNDCRWPIGLELPFKFCACPKKRGSSYCFTHANEARGAMIAGSEELRQKKSDAMKAHYAAKKAASA